MHKPLATAIVPAADIDSGLRNGGKFSITVTGATFRVRHGGVTVQPDGCGMEHTMQYRHDINYDRAEFSLCVGRYEYLARQGGITDDARFEVRELRDCPVDELLKKKDRKVLLLS